MSNGIRIDYPLLSSKKIQKTKVEILKGEIEIKLVSLKIVQ